MSLRTPRNPNAPAGRKHKDAPRSPSSRSKVVLAKDDEVALVAARLRTLHLAPVGDNRDRWVVRQFATETTEHHDAGDLLPGPSYLVVSGEKRELGHLEANTPREPRPTATVILTSVTPVLGSDLTDTDAARLLGAKRFRVADLQDWWMRLHDPEYLALVKGGARTSMVRPRLWERRWAAWPMLRIEWQVDPTYRPRLLSRSPGAGPSYVSSTSQALTSAGEAVDEAYQDHLTSLAQNDNAEAQAAHRREHASRAEERRAARRALRNAERTKHRLSTDRRKIALQDAAPRPTPPTDAKEHGDA